MFGNFNKLIPEIIYETNKNIIKNTIPIHERWECRDFKVKEKKIESYEEILEKMMKKSDVKLLTK